MSEAQLACLLPVCGSLAFCALLALGDLCGRAVGGLDTPADPIETARVLGGHAVRILALVPAVVLGAVAALFAWRVRP